MVKYFVALFCKAVFWLKRSYEEFFLPLRFLYKQNKIYVQALYLAKISDPTLYKFPY